MVIFFSATCTATWALIFATLSCTPYMQALLAAPEFAVGWLVMRTTSRLRMPLNLALAAPLARRYQLLSEFKVSPLLAVFAADEETKARMQTLRQKMEESPRHSELSRRYLRASLSGLGNFWRWAEGPIDKYGLAYFLASKVSNVATLTGATVVSMHGLDVAGFLSSWGASTELQSNSGLLACAAVMNIAFVPLHFFGAARIVQGLEQHASQMWHATQEDLQQKKEIEGQLSENEEQQLEMSEAQMTTALVGFISFFACCVDIAFGLFIIRRLYTSQTSGTGGDGESDASAGASAAEDEASEAAEAADVEVLQPAVEGVADGTSSGETGA